MGKYKFVHFLLSNFVLSLTLSKNYYGTEKTLRSLNFFGFVKRLPV